MTDYLLPNPRFQYVTADGSPASGYQLFTWANNSNTAQTTYTDASGATPNTNPIILDSTGSCDVWAPAGQLFTIALATPTDSNPPATPLWVRNNVSVGGGIATINFGADTGLVNASVAAIAGISSLYAGLAITLDVAVTSTGPATLNLNGFGAKPIVLQNGGALGPGQLQANGQYLLQYSGTAWQVLGISVFYPATSQEVAASVTPTIYVPSLQIDLERYGGGVGAPNTANSTALTNALAVITQKGGGTLIARGSGTYLFSDPGANGFVLPGSMVIQGDGYDTIWSCPTASTSSFLVASGGRNEIREMILLGPGTGVAPAVGTLVGFGLVAAGGLIMGRKVQIGGFGTALRMGNCIWGEFSMCEFGAAAGGAGVYSNATGVDFNFLASGSQVNAVTFLDCIIANNANKGVTPTYVPQRMNSIRWLGCTFQNNCINTPTNPQFYMGAVVGVSIDNFYMETAAGSGNANPIFIRLDGLNSGAIRNFTCNVLSGTATYAFRDIVGNSVNQMDIEDGTLNGTFTVAPIYAASEVDVMARNISGGAGSVITGSGSAYLPSGSGLASWPYDLTTTNFSPALVTATSGPPTQSLTGTPRWSQTGNMVTFSAVIAWSSLASGSGVVTITGLPVAANSAAAAQPIQIGEFTGITLSSQQLAGQIAANSTTITLYLSGASGGALTTSALGSSGSIAVSGTYQT